MIKVEHKSLPEIHAEALAFECAFEKDLPVLDLIADSFRAVQNARVGFVNSQRLLVHLPVDKTLDEMQAEAKNAKKD